MTTYDVIVLGTGGVGSAAAFHLARRGYGVLGLDRYPGGHDQGSSHGQTRIIRMAYFEHPDYVPLLRRAYELWTELEHLSGQQLFVPAGLLQIGPPAGVVIPGVLQSARQHRLPVETLDMQTARARFPGFVLPEGFSAVFEPAAGYLFVEPCVLAHLAEARRLGADLRTGHSVLEWNTVGKSIRVRTDKETFEAGAMVVAAGAWAGTVLADLGVRLSVRRKHLHWYRATSDRYRVERRAPTFLYEIDDGAFYGFPQVDDRGVKVAEHSGGVEVNDPRGDDRSVDARDRARVEAFLARCLPDVSNEARDHVVCYYTMSPDEHFILDRHPQHDRVCFAAGLSGHGFKFTTVLGEILADLAVNGQTDHPIQFLNCRRQSLRAPKP